MKIDFRVPETKQKWYLNVLPVPGRLKNHRTCWKISRLNWLFSFRKTSVLNKAKTRNPHSDAYRLPALVLRAGFTSCSLLFFTFYLFVRIIFMSHRVQTLSTRVSFTLFILFDFSFTTFAYPMLFPLFSLTYTSGIFAKYTYFYVVMTESI